ncbi:glycosyltransferase family 4 protein [Modestobacter sp. VKM Ac-2979]|uniref:glycosyltransferase family 4 protein n=1 Tax=unclassified Modestobacter TaxID=2643866 RepID=UPI0022AB9880|nr:MULTISPECIES: glycosyltransferase family 4 protein [unclassified Modestobacter]MCZ2810564.1 glycosyltransferase family 4 protein [Modestobacter sp. VKM Ac-2979]MCZ2842050.1 glycosyltransferase family 4 protein [Modestobacter sp. VKM Ac-2980]
MRICFVSRRYWPAVSGMSVYAENLLRELVALGHEVTLVSQYRDDEAGTRVYGGGVPPADRVPAGVEVHALPSRGETVVPADWEGDIEEVVRTVVELHEQRPFDVLHAQYGYPPGLAVLEASRRTGVPNLVSIQGGDGHWVGTCCSTHADAMHTVLDHAGAVLIGSASFRDEVVGNLGTVPARFQIVPGATDTRRFTPGDRPLGSLADPPVLLFHGRVDRRKGVLDLLEALPDDVRLVVSGIGPDLDEARARADGRTTFLGYVPPDDAPAVYRTADVFVSPTYSEGFSNTLLEAMASGLPTVSTDSVGVVDCLRHEENGLLHAPGDVAGLRTELDRLLGDAALRTRLATTALEEVRRLYSWPVLARSIDDVYTELAGTAPDLDWTSPTTVDESCRFRSAAHLL